MTKLELIGHKVLSKTSIEPEQKFGSIIALLMVISICITAIRVIQECEKNRTRDIHGDDLTSFYREKFKYLSLKRGWYTNLRLKKIIRQHMDIDNYRLYKNELKEAILETSKDLSEKETYSLMEAANND